MKEFEIWMEGYVAQGDSSKAQLIGKGYGETFDDVVKDYMAKNENHGISENSRQRYISEKAYNNRDSKWNIWACNLFDNEKDARRSFG